MNVEDTQDPLTQSQEQHTSNLKARKKKIYLMALVLITFIYFGAALAFRAYRMDPRNQYYGSYLPGSSPIHSTTAEETDKIIHAITRGPTFLERLFYPAEFVLTSIGI